MYFSNALEVLIQIRSQEVQFKRNTMSSGQEFVP